MSNPSIKVLTRLADTEVCAVLSRMGPPLRVHAAGVPVIYEAWPDDALVAEGYDPDLLGLFCGLTRDEMDGDATGVPPTIILFLENIWDEAGGVESRFREEVRVTYVHELGHYLGLDEGDLELRDLA